MKRVIHFMSSVILICMALSIFMLSSCHKDGVDDYIGTYVGTDTVEGVGYPPHIVMADTIVITAGSSSNMLNIHFKVLNASIPGTIYKQGYCIAQGDVDTDTLLHGYMGGTITVNKSIARFIGTHYPDSSSLLNVEFTGRRQ